MEIESIRVLKVTKDDGSIEHFNEGSIVGIVEKNDTCHIGKITFVDTDSVEIDASKEFAYGLKSIKYKNVESIKLINPKQGI